MMIKNALNATKGWQQCLDLLGGYVSVSVGDGMLSVDGVRIPTYLS